MVKFNTLVLCLILICTSHFGDIGAAREVTHEDIRDAMLSFVRMFRGSEEKLERHESREKALGEQLKKALANLDKKHKSLEPLKGAISRLDERLSNVETILIQKDEREKQQMQKNNEVIESVQTMLNIWSSNIANVIKAEINAIKMPTLDNASIETKIKNLEDGVNKKINGVTKLVEGVKDAVMNLKYEQNNSVNNCKDPGINEKVINKYVSETEKMLTKFDTKLMEYNLNISKINTNPQQLQEILAADEAWHHKMASALDAQQINLWDLRKDIQILETALKHSPTKSDIEIINNQTQKILQESKYEIVSGNEKGVMKLLELVKHLVEQSKTAEDSVIRSIANAESETENRFSQIVKSYEQLRTEMQALTKGERVMLQTADNVLDTKRRIEYGVHQILLEVGELIKDQTKGFNSTVIGRFDDIESSIVNSQVGALANLTSKIEYEISQVWRQMGIMHQQVTASNTALDRLQAQTDKYVNGSITTMDSMEGKVGMITSRMTEVDDNLNYLLGRLSLVTQEFNQIKVGLGDALDNIKHSFLTVQSKIKEAGPGPHDIQKPQQT